MAVTQYLSYTPMDSSSPHTYVPLHHLGVVVWSSKYKYMVQLSELDTCHPASAAA